MRELVMQTMQTYGMYAQGGVVLAAVSGGRDSMALLHVLHALQNELGFTLGAVHVNHGLRNNAMAEQRLVETFAHTLDVPLRTAAVAVPTNIRSGESVEMAARRLRYAAFKKALAAYPQGTVVATAHHQKDQAETVLMRLLRGTGTRGLAGIRPRRGAYVRPMLFVPDACIGRYAHQASIPYRTDESNADTEYMRNRIRHTLLPVLKEQYNPNLERALGAVAKAVYEDDTYLQTLACAQREAVGWQHVPDLAVYMNKEALLALPIPLKKRMVRGALERLGFYHMEARLLEEAFRAIETDGAAQITEDIFVRGGQIVQIYRALAPCRDEIPLPAGGTCKLGMFTVQAEISHEVQGNCGMWSAQIDGDAATHIKVRTRRAGDVIAYGFGHKKLSDAMIDNHIPFCIRDHLPVVVCGGAVVWVPGLRVADRFAPKKEKKRALKITVRPAPLDGGSEHV